MKHPRILAIAPSSRGFGYALLEGQATLVNWGKRQPKGNKSKGTLKHVEMMLADYGPQVVVMEDASAKGSRRAPRIRKLTENIKKLAAKRRIKVALFSRKRVMEEFFPNGNGTKYEIAKLIGERFQDELGFALPPKRRAWDNVDPRMDMFDAIALALMMHERK